MAAKYRIVRRVIDPEVIDELAQSALAAHPDLATRVWAHHRACLGAVIRSAIEAYLSSNVVARCASCCAQLPAADVARGRRQCSDCYALPAA